MQLDIDPILLGWQYRPDEVTVRIIEGDEGRRKVQLRLDLGVLQMEFDGRPDGRRIHGCESWLEYHQLRQGGHDAENPDGAPYLLEPEDCAELLREGVQYYHRYVSFWHLQCYELCARDTERNLRLFAFVRDHARHDRDKMRFDQWRPYVTMMHACAVATPLVQLEQWDAAVGVIDAGIRGIERFLEEYDQVSKAPQVGELAFLRRWKNEILTKPRGHLDESASAETTQPIDRIAGLHGEIKRAIQEERYEDASRLRDDLRRISAPPSDG
ncbi:MAG: UvrB/UvrC motif-containing protein [Planctomycetes bacterium]|nr:UvrB/UvrC motif-containing protein [Planctomycetota bacterium]